MKISNNNIFYSLEKTFVILFGMIMLAGCSSTKQSSPAPAPVPAATTETEEEVYDDPTNIMSGEFARVLAKVEGRELNPRDPDHVRADGLDDLEVNAAGPDGRSIQTAVVIPERLDLWHRQKTEIRWIQNHHPGQHFVMHSILMRRKEGKWYDVVSTTDKLGGETMNFYFDVSASF
jgi:hypothetical protein